MAWYFSVATIVVNCFRSYASNTHRNSIHYAISWHFTALSQKQVHIYIKHITLPLSLPFSCVVTSSDTASPNWLIPVFLAEIWKKKKNACSSLPLLSNAVIKNNHVQALKWSQYLSHRRNTHQNTLSVQAKQ
jgi:hypothetical protein